MVSAIGLITPRVMRANVVPFQPIRDRLLWSYLAVSTVILGAFAIAVRLVFVHILTYELTEELTIVAQAAAADRRLAGKQLILPDDQILVSPDQVVQWFDEHSLPRRGRLGKSHAQAMDLALLNTGMNGECWQRW